MTRMLRLLGGPSTLTPMLVVLGVATAAAGFAGWKVRDWACDAAQTRAAETTLENAVEAQDEVNEEAGAYEATRADADARGRAAQAEVVTIYRDLPAPPVSCTPPDDAERLLREAVASANARATGQPLPALPNTAGAAPPSN